MPVVRQGDDSAEGTLRGILVTATGRERVRKGNRRVKGLGSEETGIAGLDICYWKGHTADKMVRKCKNVHKKGYVHDVKRYPVIEEAKARLRGISLAEEVVLDILAGEQGEEGKDASRLADRIVEECRRIGIVDERFRVDSREDSQPAASAQHCLPSVMRRWMIDSGCAMDLIAEADLTQDEKDMAIEAKKVRFNTANGNTTSKQEICMDIQGMPETMRIRMLESTPAVLSMGRRCMKMGYSFHWLAGANPVFVKPDSSLIVLKVIGDIPYMVDRMSTVVSESERSDYHIYPAMPAPLAIELPVRGNSSPRRIGEKQDECSPKSVDSDTDRDIEEEPIGKAANDDGRLLDKWMLTGNKAVCFHNKPRTKACDPWFETLKFPEIHALVPRFAERCRSKRVYEGGKTVAEWIDWVDKCNEGESRDAEKDLWTGKTMFKIEGLTFEGADAGEAVQSDSAKVRKHILNRMAADENAGLDDLMMMLDKNIGTGGEAETLVEIARCLWPLAPQEILDGGKAHKPQGETRPEIMKIRKAIEGSRRVIVHICCGKSRGKFDDIASELGMSVIDIDMEENVLRSDTWWWLVKLATTNLVFCWLAGPPCRTRSVMRYRRPGPIPLRSRNGPERWGYSFISWAQKQECRDDDIIILRVCMLVVIGKARHRRLRAPTMCLIEQPQDPETYWDDTPEGGYASLWATEEWDRTSAILGTKLFSFDQGPMGHSRKKPTTIATDAELIGWAVNLRGPGTGATNDGNDRSKGEMSESQNWSEWAPGLVRAIKETMRKHHRISSVVEKGIDERNRETTTEQDDGDGRLRTTFYCAACKADSSGVCGFCERALSPEQIEAGQSARNMTDAEFQLIHGMKKSPDDDLRIAEQVVAVPGEEESAENGGELDEDIDLPGIADEEQARRGVGEPQKDDSAGDMGEVEQVKAEDGPADQVRVADRIGEGIGSSKTVSIRRARYSPEYAKSTEHLLTHLPKNMHCVACRQGKAINVPFNRGEGITDKGAEKFGERVTADTIVLRSNKDKGIRGENNAIVMFDFKTQWIHCTPVKSRGTDEFVRAINEFRGPDMVVHLYADGAGEFSKACDVIGTCRATSTPGLPRTNSIAELKVKEVIYGGRVLLRQAGLEPKWWPYAVQTFCFHRNVQQVDGVSPYGKRHGNEQDKVKLIPFGALVNYLPIAEKPRKAGKEDAALLERGDPENDALEILGADEDVSSMALPSETKETKEQRSQREEELREIDRRALDMVMTQDFDVQHAKDIILKFTSIEKGIAKNSRSMATGRGFIVLGLYAYGGKVGVTNSAKEYPGIAMVCCELIAKCFPEATFTTVIVSVGTRMGPHKDKFNESQTYNFVVPVSERAGEAMIWTEEEQCASEGGKAAGIEKEVLPGKWIWGRTRKVDSGLKFNPRVWHATEDALAPEDRVIAVGYTLAAGKKASMDDKWKLMRLGFRLDEHFATLADGLCQAACADDGGDGEEYVDHDAEEEQAYAMASKAKFDTPTSPGLFLGYALQPGGVPSGDYIVVELAHLYHGWTVPSIHRVKRIVLDEEMPNYFPMQAVADRKSRIMTATRADALARLELEREGQQGEETEEIFAEERRVRADVMRQIKCDDQHLQNGDFWEHDEIDHSWTLHHILPRKELCTPGEEVKGTGGPGDRELGPRRRTWIVYADGTSEVLDEDRMKGKKKITKKWTGCTTFWEKGEPEGEIDDEAKERARGEKATGIRGVGLDYEQDMPRIERPYARSHKPNSISSAEWNRMSPGQRLRYIEGDKERIIRGERPPSAVRGQEEIGPRPAEIGVREWMEKITDHGQEFSPPEYRWDPPPGMPEGGRVWAVRNNRATSYRFYGGRDKRRLELWWRVTRSANTGEVLESIEYDSCIQAEMMRNRGRYRFVVPRDIITEFWYIPDGGEDRRVRDRGESAEPAAPASRMGDTEGVTKTINQLCSTAGIARTPSDNIVGEMMRELGEQPKVQIMGVGIEEIGGNGGENVSWISGEGCVIGEGVTDVVIAIDASSDGMRTEVDRKASGWRREEGLDSTREARERVFGNVEKVITDANSRGIVATIIWIGGKSRMADETIVRMALAWDMWIVRSDGCMLGMHDGVDASCYIGVVAPCMMNAIAADMLACDHMPRDHDLMSRIVRTSDAKIDVRREQEGKAIREMIKVLKDVIDICGEEEGDSVSMACEEHEGDYLGYSSGMVTLDVDSLAQLEKGTIRGDETGGSLEKLLKVAKRRMNGGNSYWVIDMEGDDEHEEYATDREDQTLIRNYAAAAAEDGAPYISREEIRWKRCIVMNNPGREALREIFGPRAKHTQDLRVILVDGDDIGKVMMTKQNSRRIRHSTGGAAVAYPGEELEVGDLNGDGWMIVLTGERENHDADRRHDQDREENPGFDDQSDVFDSEGWTLSDLEEEREPVDEAFFRAGHAETINLETMEKGECNIVMWEAERNALVLELKDDIHVPLIGYTWVRTGIAYPEDPGTSVRVSALGQLVAETMCDVIGYEVSPEREILVAIQNRNSFPITFGGGGGPIMRMEFAKGVCLRPRMRGCMMPENVKEVRHRRAHRESKKAIWAREARARERDRDSVDHGLRARRSRDEDRRRIGIKHVSNRTYKCRECRRLLEGKAKVPSLILTSMTLCFACFMNKHTTPVDNLIRQGYQTEDEEYGDGIVAVPAIQVDADQEDSWEEVAENEVCDSIDETVGECEPLMATIIEDEEEDIEEVFGLVARPVTKAERAINPKARAALDKEWKKLMDQVVWIMEEVRSWKDVQREAMDRGEIAHVGRIFDICVEKNWELAEDDPLRKYKGRVVFEGCHVKDQEGKWAIFQEITSCPARLEAGKMADAYGMLPGHDIEMSDGESAYTQALLGGPKTWIRIPRDRWPDEWEGIDDPVVPLRLALYGHPDAGGFWEKHCEKAVTEVGFEFLSDWPSVFFHKELKLMLVIYVDDFKLAGPKENLAIGWEKLAKRIKLEEPRSMGRYLGCLHTASAIPFRSPFEPRHEWTKIIEPKKEPPNFAGKAEAKEDSPDEIRILRYDVTDFMKQCVDRYQELCSTAYPKPLDKAKTPYLDESRPEFDENPVDDKVNEIMGIAKYELPDEGPGVLKEHAPAVLMKILYGARVGRYDLLRPVQVLASRLTTWTHLCDKRMHRLISYINETTTTSLYGWVGDRIGDIRLVLYCDADLASDKNDHRSTSGVYLCLQGPHTFVPIAAYCKKQTSCSKSTPEAEIVALHDGITKQGIPGLALWEMMKESIEPLIVAEDNEAAVRVIVSGKNPNMRYLSRTQRIDIARLNQFYEAVMFTFVNCPTEYQAANMMTKAINEAREWLRDMYTTAHFGEEEFRNATGTILAMPACRGVSQNQLEYDIRDNVGIAKSIVGRWIIWEMVWDIKHSPILEVDEAIVGECDGIVVIAPKRVDSPSRLARGAELKLGRKDQSAADSLALLVDRVIAAGIGIVLINRSDAAISEGIARILAARGKLARMRGKTQIGELHDKGEDVQCTIYINEESKARIESSDMVNIEALCNALQRRLD